MTVCVVHKVAKYEVLRGSDPELLERLSLADPAMLHRLQQGAQRQAKSLDRCVAALESAGLPYEVLSRDHFEGAGADVALILALGGDGTVLDVSHRVLDHPILGVNSDPHASVGYFCACDPYTLASALQRWQDCRIERSRLQRMSLRLNGVAYPYPCMNDVLVCSRNPAMMSRYVLSAGTRSEEQSSSGIWLATPAGSTAGIRSAGGTVLPIEEALFQYLVREPYVGKRARYELLRGVRGLDEGITLRSLMQDGCLYVDGPYMRLPFVLGDTLEVSRGRPLHLLGMHPDRRER